MKRIMRKPGKKFMKKAGKQETYIFLLTDKKTFIREPGIKGIQEDYFCVCCLR
jgi:hypothetical protein